VIIDLTTLEKRGKFKALNRLVRVYHSKRGLHLVVLYLVVGQWPVPWSFRVYRGSTITWWGKRRWQIEAWFKTAKHHFGLDCFGQGPKLGVYRWLVLSLIAYLLAYWAYLSTSPSVLPDWGQAAQLALETLLPHLVLLLLLLEIRRLQPLARKQGFDIHICCKI